jgi:Ca2+-binding RTX toxin-like protein
VLLGNGDGTFKRAITTNLPVQANSLAVGDFNRDGKLDLVFTNNSNNTVEVLRGNGDGTFQSNPLILPVGAGPTSVAVGDFQHDGKLELAVTNGNSNTVSVLLGNGDGTFQAARNIAVGTVPTSVVAVDLGNGQVDLVVANLSSNNVSVLLGNGDGTFRSGQTIAVANASNAMVGDFNGDGKPDVMIEELPPGDAIATSEVVLFGNGDGTLHPGATQLLGSSLFGLAVADFSGDGKQDIAVLNPLGPLGGNLLEVFSGNGDGTFATPPDNFPTGGDPFGVAAGDFNGDGRPDLAVANAIGGNVGVLLNTSATAVGVTAMFSAVDGRLTILGDAQDNTIVVSRDAAGNILVNNGAVAIQGGPATVANTSSIVIRGGAGNDNLSLNEANGPLPRASLAGDDGNDTLIGGSGNDTLEGGGGNDILTGRAGNDIYRFDTDNALGSDTIDESGGGVDTLDFSATTTRAVAVNLGLAGAQVVNAGLTLTLSSGATIENVIGGALGDTITGNALNNSLSGGAGNDTLDGGAGTDTLNGGAGTDVGINGEVLINIP